MDILDDVTPAQGNVPLEDLVSTDPQRVYAPDNAIRSRAATGAILESVPEDVIEVYEMKVAEAKDGRDDSQQLLMANIEAQNRKYAEEHFMLVLGDRNASPEMKRMAMESLTKPGVFKEDPSKTLQSDALIADNPDGDEQEEVARISLAEVLNELEVERVERQKMINNFAARLPEAVGGAFVTDLATHEVLPFGRNIIAANVNKAINKELGQETGFMTWAKDFLTPGTTKQEIRRKLDRIPVQNRAAFTNTVLNAIKNSSAIFPSENAYTQWQLLTNLLENEPVSDGWAWAENILSLFDLAWLGSGVKRLTKPGEQTHKANWELVDDDIPPKGGGKGGVYYPDPTQKRIEMNTVIRLENPASPINVVEQTNPSQARAMNSAIVSGDDEIAQALAGVNRDQALSNMSMPQMGGADGAVTYKVYPAVKDFLSDQGTIRYTQAEVDSATGKIKRDFRKVNGMVMNDAMTTFTLWGDTLSISAHYQREGGLFADAALAKEQALLALRKFGVRDDEVVVMKREGLDFVPLKDVQNQPPGEYMVRVETKHTITDQDVEQWSPFQIKRNWTDRASFTGTENYGALSGWLFSKAAMIDPVMVKSLYVGVDSAVNLEKLLVTPLRELRSKIETFPKQSRSAIEEYFFEANTRGLKFDRVALAAKGFNDTEISVIKEWRDFWDTHYYLENLDLIHTLDSQGFKLFVGQGNTQLVAKEVAKDSSIVKVYDPDLDQVIIRTKPEMDALYASGGTYARFRRPQTINGEEVGHMIVRNTGSSYMRKFRDTDSILNYRDGYFTIYYKAPQFIDEITVAANGAETVKTIAVAGSIPEAEAYIRLQSVQPNVRYRRREDARGFRKDTDTYWDMMESGGRIAQRTRGQPLQTVQGVNHIGTGGYIAPPMESATRAAKSVAGRLVVRKAIETAKTRTMAKYGHLSANRDQFGNPMYPSNRSQIIDDVSHTSPDVADFRTIYQYIKQIEDGYINSADEMYKAFFNIMAEGAGKLGIGNLERGMRGVGNIRPTVAGKGTVFHSYISFSMPLRQWIVQGHQAGRMMAYNPQGVIDGSILRYVGGYADYIAGTKISTSADVKEFVDLVNRSGLLDGVDRNSLVRGIGLSLADESNSVFRAMGKVMHAPQEFGFNVGERMNMLGHLAAVYDRMRRTGVDMTEPTNRERVMALARSLSYGMNRANEFDYVQGSLALALQFVQMPHKAYMQAFDRTIPRADRAKLLAFDLAFWGIPKVGAYAIGSHLLSQIGVSEEEYPDIHKVINEGLEPYLFNIMAAHIDGEYDEEGKLIVTEYDFNSLRNLDMDGFVKLLEAVWEGGYAEFFAQSPAGTLMATPGIGDGTNYGRIPKAIRTLSRYFNIIDEIDPENPTAFKDVLRDAARITSGWNAFEKARMMHETGRLIDRNGNIIHDKASYMSVLMQGLGFPTIDQAKKFESTQMLYKAKERHERQIRIRYNELKQYVRDSLGQSFADYDHVQKVSSLILRSFTPGELEVVQKLFVQDITNTTDISFIKTLMNSVGIGVPVQDMVDAVNRSNLPDREKRDVLEMLRETQNLRTQLETKKGNK